MKKPNQPRYLPRRVLPTVSLIAAFVVTVTTLFQQISIAAESYPAIGPLAQRAAPKTSLVKMGHRLFFEARISGDGAVSCATCHDPQQGDWLVGYYYADIETLAVNSSFAQDDWMRWGSATDTRGSDFHGHEFRFGYVLPWKWKLLARFYSVESNNNPEDGNRFRIDFNRKFW